MKPLTLSAVTQGIQRVREKGSPDAGSLYELRNGYVGIDGSMRQRPGTAEDAALPAGTIGLMAWNNKLVVFAGEVKSMPSGYACEVIIHPFFPSTGLRYIWFAAPFLGYPYVVAEFTNGDVYHYWLQAANKWEASTGYLDGQIIVPSTPNGLAYKAHRATEPYPKWAAGEVRNIGDKREPTNPNGFYYEVIETSEAQGVGTPGGSPNPNPPGTPGGDGGPGGTGGGFSPLGVPASSSPGPNGGFADNAPQPVPLPTAPGTNEIGPDGDFSIPGSLVAWKGQTGTPLDARWTIDTNRAKFTGINEGTAFYFDAQQRMPFLPMPRFTVTVTGSIQTDAGVEAAIGVGVGYNTAGGLPGSINCSPMVAYPVETPVTYVYQISKQQAGVTGTGQYVVGTFEPMMRANNPGVTAASAYFKNVTMKVDPVVVPVTAATPAHLNFDTGLADWTAWPPDASGDTFILSATAGEVTAGKIVASATDRIIYCNDPLTALDAAGKYAHITGEVWSDDPTVFSGITKGGVTFGLAIVDNLGQLQGKFFGIEERGDWTARENWVRSVIANGTGGNTIHVAVKMGAAVGYRAKVRNLAVSVTDAVID